MGSKTSKETQLGSTKTKAVITPRTTQDIAPGIPIIPQDIIHEILDHLAAGSDFRSLRACALVSKPWVHPCRQHTFHTIEFSLWKMNRWFSTFPVPEECPAHYIREVEIWIGGDRRAPEEFFEYTPWFTGVERMAFVGRVEFPPGYAGDPLWREPSSWRLPQSVTSLNIETTLFTLVHLRDVMAQLPNLEDLSLTGCTMSKERWMRGIGAAPRGRFGGRLILRNQYVEEDAVNVLLEIPSGLRFTEVQIHCAAKFLPSAVRVVEEFGKTLVKLSYNPIVPCKSHPFSSSGWF